MSERVKRDPLQIFWSWMFMILIVFLPFQFALDPTDGVDLAIIRVIIILVILLWLFFGLTKKQIVIPSFWLSASLLSFLVLSGISLYTAENTAWGLRKYAFLLSIMPIYFVVADLVVRRKISAYAIIKSIIVSGTLVAGIGILQFILQFIIGLEPLLFFWRSYIAPFFLGTSFAEAVVGFPSWLVNISGYTVFRSTAFFPDPHMYAFFLNLCLPWAIFAYLCKKDVRYGIAALMMAVGVALSFSRGAYLGLFVGVCIMIVYGMKQKNIRTYVRSYIRPAWALFLGFLMSVAIISLFLVNNPVQQRFLSSFDLNEGSNVGRLETWKEAYSIWQDDTFFGVGIGNYALEVKPSADYREPIYAHNLYLDILVESGIFTLTAWLILIMVSIFGFIRNSKKDVLYGGGVASLVVFSVHAFFDTPLYSVHILPLLMITLALGSIWVGDKAVFKQLNTFKQ